MGQPREEAGRFLAMGMALHRNHHLLELAKALRRFSGETGQDSYIEKFLHVADDLERHAQEPRKKKPARPHIDMKV